MSVARFSLFVLALSVVGCSSGRDVHPVPELDQVTLDVADIRTTSGKGDVRAKMGDPPFVGEDPSGVMWWYPIRIPQDVPVLQVVSAAVLNVSLDSAGRVDEWGFFHPVSGARLEIRERLEEADAWYRKLCNPPARIELAAVLKKGTPKTTVLNSMRWFTAWPTRGSFMERILVRNATDHRGETLTFYADRPSPLYIPPFYLEVTFYSLGKPTTGTTLQGWGGCK